MVKRPLCLAAVVILGIQLVLANIPVLKKTEGVSPELSAWEESGVVVQGKVYRREERPKYEVYYLTDNQICREEQFKNKVNTKKALDVWHFNNANETGLLIYIKKQTTEDDKKIEENDKEIGKEIAVGNTIRVQGKLKFFEEATNPGNFNQKFYYRKQKIAAAVWCEQAQILDFSRYPVREGLAALRIRWKKLLVENLGEHYGNSMSAILLGDKSELDAEVKAIYQKSGIGHILAISGLHMSFIGIGLYQFLRKAGVGFFPAGVAGSIFLLLYTLMIGAGVSALRALLMYMVRMGAEIVGRDYDLLSSLSLAAIVITAWQPLYLKDAGFLLSFGAILGIAWIEPVLEKTGVPKVFCSGLGIHFMLLPVMLYFYFEIPVWSVFLNLLVIPLMPVVLGAGLAGTLCSIFWKTGGKGLLFVCKGILFLYETCCDVTMKMPFTRIVPGQPPKVLIVLYYVILVVICIEKNQKGFRRVKFFGFLLLSVCFCTGTAVSHQHPKTLQVTAVDVGQGDCLYMQMPDGLRCMVDGGSSDVSDVGTGRIEPFLKSQGVGRLDYVFVSHGDADHINGIEEFLRNGQIGIQVETLVLPEKSVWDDALRKLADTALENHVRTVSMTEGEQIGKSCRLTCLAPGKTYRGEPGNAASMVLELKYGAFDMLFTGDLEGEGEDNLTESGCLKKYDIVKAAHHGSKNSTSEQFLKETSPTAVWISSGRGNRYGHPHKETLQRLKTAGCQVYHTQENGAVTVSTDGKNMKIKTYKCFAK